MRNRGGFTIVEVIIVLAITSFLFFIGVSAISSRQARTEFAQGMREIDSRLKDALNDVANGFFPTVNHLACTAAINNLAPTLSYDSSRTDTTGLNSSCVFAGKVVHIGTEVDSQVVNIYSLAGRRQYFSGASGSDVQNFSQLKPIAIHPAKVQVGPNSNDINATETTKLPNNIRIIKNDGTDGGWAFGVIYRNFQGSTTGSSTSGTTNIGIAKVTSAVVSGNAAMSVINVINKIDTLADTDFLNANDSITLCFKSGSSDQNAIIQISGANGGMTTLLSFDVDLAAQSC